MFRGAVKSVERVIQQNAAANFFQKNLLQPGSSEQQTWAGSSTLPTSCSSSHS